MRPLHDLEQVRHMGPDGFERLLAEIGGQSRTIKHMAQWFGQDGRVAFARREYRGPDFPKVRNQMRADKPLGADYGGIHVGVDVIQSTENFCPVRIKWDCLSAI